MNTDEHGSGSGKRWTAWVAGGLLGMAALTLAGCSLPEAQPDLTRFYVLTAAPANAAAPVTEAGGPRRVFLRSVVVPEYLRGKVMQVRVAENEVKYVDVSRWAEPLEAGLGRVVRENLARAGNGVRVVTRGGDERDVEVVVQLRRCEGVLPAGVARLAAHVEVYTAGVESKLVAQEDFTTDIAGWDGQDYGQLAAKLSEAAAALSARIAALVGSEQS